MSLGFRASLIANLALVAIALALGSRPSTPSPTVANRRIPTAPPTVVKPVPAPDRGGPDRVTPGAIARLERAGVPRTMLADILRQDFRRRWSKRIVALENRYAPKQPPQREYIALQRQQDEEQIRELKAAFGEEGYLALDKEETLRKLNFEEVPLQPAESEQAYQLQKQLETKLRDLQLAMEDGDADIADMGTLQLQAQDAYEQGLQKLLGQKRYEQLKGYTLAVVEGHLEFNELSPSDEQVAAIKGAESEYRAHEAALAQQLRDKPAEAATLAAELKTLADTREANIRKVVGADAYDALQREHDIDYQALQQFSAAWNLKDTEIDPVFERVKAFRDNVDSLRQAAHMNELAGQTVDWNAINATIAQSRQQTEAALANLIGGDRVRRLTRNGLLSPLGSERNAPHPPPTM